MYHLNYANFKDELECGIKIGLEHARYDEIIECREKAEGMAWRWRHMPALATAMSYYAGIIEGKKIERLKKRKAEKDLRRHMSYWNFAGTKKGAELFKKCKENGDMEPYMVARTQFLYDQASTRLEDKPEWHRRSFIAGYEYALKEVWDLMGVRLKMGWPYVREVPKPSKRKIPKPTKRKAIAAEKGTPAKAS